MFTKIVINEINDHLIEITESIKKDFGNDDELHKIYNTLKNQPEILYKSKTQLKDDFKELFETDIFFKRFTYFKNLFNTSYIYNKL